MPSSVALPSRVEPSLKLTLPVGVPAPGAVTLTVAVKVTFCPKTDGLGALLRVVLVPAVATVLVTALEVLLLKLPSPM